jgi:hypothetical protein
MPRHLGSTTCSAEEYSSRDVRRVQAAAHSCEGRVRVVGRGPSGLSVSNECEAVVCCAGSISFGGQAALQSCDVMRGDCSMADLDTPL